MKFNLFVLILLLESFFQFLSSNAIKLSNKIFYECSSIETSEIGVVYLSIPIPPDPDNSRYKKSTYKLTSYYTLLLLSKYFNVSTNDRLLFYHINNLSIPEPNHFNRWLNDPFWTEKIPIGNIKFLNIEYQTINSLNDFEDINFYLLLQHVIDKSIYHFDRPKKYVLLVTSDAIIGPKILSCFSLDLHAHVGLKHKRMYSSKETLECYTSIHDDDENNEFPHYSFLYQLIPSHTNKQFSGALIWKIKNTSYELSSDVSIVVDPSDKTYPRLDIIKSKYIATSYNLYKGTFKDDVILSNKMNFEDVDFIFGYELNKFDPPWLEYAFENKTHNNYFYRTIRRLLYDRYGAFEYKQLPEAKTPNIVQIIWFGDKFKVFKFIEYLCLKSILVVIKPEKIRIHYDELPFGEWWDKIKSHPKIELVYLERPLYRYGQNFTEAPIQHIADVARLEVMYEEGGLYTDLDILWVKPIDELRYIDVEVIAANDLTSYCYEFPNNIQIGTFLAQPKSSFVRDWLQGYTNYHLFPGDYTAISMCEPYKILEKTPNRLLVNNRLQMIFFNGWSLFIPRFIDFFSIREYNENMDWLNNGTYGYHLPRYGPLYSYDDYKEANRSEIPIQIATYILNLPFD